MKLWQRRRFVRELRGASVYAKSVLSIIADHVKDDDPTCWLSQRTLCEETGIKHLATIRKATAELERLGIVAVTRPKKFPGAGNACTYRVMFERKEIRQDVTYSSPGNTSGRDVLIRQKPPEKYVKSPPENTSRRVHQPLNQLTVGARRAAPNGHAPSRPPEQESPARRRRRDLIDLASILGVERAEGESESGWLDRVAQANDLRIKALEH